MIKIIIHETWIRNVYKIYKIKHIIIIKKTKEKLALFRRKRQVAVKSHNSSPVF